MLSLEKPFTIDGISVFRDHADPNTFWYLPGPVDLARRDTDGRLAFSCLKYKSATPGGGVKGGGFLMFESTLKLPDRLEQRILARVQAEPGVTGQVRLTAAAFEEGSVQCIALNVQGSGSTTAAAPPPGAFNAVELILGATIPSMDSANKAAFSLTLSAEGATILEQAFQDGLTPIGVVYSMKYMAMRPSLDVEITADFERMFTHFSASLEGQYQFFRAGIDAAFESLVQSGAIKIKVFHFTDEQDEKDQEKWALDFFKEDLLSKWFEPTLTPGQLAASQATTTPLSEVISTGQNLLQGNRPSTTTSTNTGSTAQPGQSTEQIQPASLITDRTDPSPLPSGYGVAHTPAGQGLQESITVTGTGAVLKVNGSVVALDAGGRATVTVDPNSDKNIEVDWPAQTETREEVFGLFFDFDKPTEAGWKTNPPSPDFRAYVENTTTDPRFRDASGTLRIEGDGNWSGPERGADRLRAWIQALPAPKQVRLDAYASHEHVSGASEPDRERHNTRLSQRRLDVAQAIVQRSGGQFISSPPHGDSPASTRPGTHTPMGGDPDNRVVHVTGRVAGTGRPVLFRGHFHRPASIQVEQPRPQPQPQPQPQPNAGGSNSSTPVVASLKLKFIRQEERKTLTFRYNRAEAVRRTYAPQGFFGLLLKDQGDKSKYFKEIDLDDPFFREFKVEASIPIDFARIGLSSGQVALDYGNPADPLNHKHGDFVFTSNDPGPKEFRVFMNETRDIDYAVSTQYHFDPQSGWTGDRFSYEIPPSRTQDRTLFVNPYEHVEFREIPIVPGDIDWQVLSSIEVRLQAEGYSTPEPHTTFILQENSAPQSWKLRGTRPAPPNRRVTVGLTHNLKDGTSQTTPSVEIDVPSVVVHDPFVDALRLEFIPLFNPTNVQRVFIDVEYKDTTNAYERSERLEVPGTQTNPAKLRIALRDKDHRRYRFRLTFVGTNSGFDQRAWVETEEQLIPVQ